MQKSENNSALASAATVLNATDKPGCLVTQSLNIVAANTAWKNLLGKASGDGETELDRHVRPLYSLNKVDYREVAKAIGFIAMPCVLVRAPKGERPRFHMLFIPDVAANTDLVVLLAPRALDDALSLEIDTPRDANEQIVDSEGFLDIDEVVESLERNPDHLSPREIEVVRLLAKGLTGGRVAAHLGIAESTVSAHVRNAMVKTGAKNRTGLVAYSMAEGLIKS